MSTECLRQETVLNNRYKIKKKLGQGGFGVTYLAMDLEIEQYVVLKECFPLYLAERDEETGFVKLIHNENETIFEKELKKFLDEARRMAKLQHISEIAKVLGYFRENHTAYMVMEFVKGTNLRIYLENMDEPFSFEQGKKFLLPVIKALGEVHKIGLIHRDLTPENILIKEDNTIRIIDFGSSREFVDDKTKTILVRSGYAPLEQYSKKEKQGPWTDVYGICAVFYEMLTGAAPQDSLSRMEADELYPPSMYGAEITAEEEQVLMKGLEQDYQQRYQSMKQLEEAFLLCERKQSKEDTEETVYNDKEVDSQRLIKKEKKKYIWGIICGAVVLCGVFGILKWNRSVEKKALENISEIHYAGNYARDSERYLEFVNYVEANAIYSENNEQGEYRKLSEAAVLEWGEPCNQMHFSKELTKWLKEMSECGWEMHLRDEQENERFDVYIKQYGAIETFFVKQNRYTCGELAEICVFYDPVNERIMEISVAAGEKSHLKKPEELLLVTADVLNSLSEYKVNKKENLIELLKEGTKIKKEKNADIYQAQSFGDVHVVYEWSEKQEVSYICKPYEAMEFSMRHEYYWP